MFFSSNNWDVSGAENFGFRTVWIHRLGVDWGSLPGSPDLTANSLLDPLEIINFCGLGNFIADTTP